MAKKTKKRILRPTGMNIRDVYPGLMVEDIRELTYGKKYIVARILKDSSVVMTNTVTLQLNQFQRAFQN